MAVSNKYARRRRNALLAAVVMALIIILIVVIIISAASGRGKKPPAVTPTPTPTFAGILLPTLEPTLDPGLSPVGTGDETLVSPTPTPTPDASAGIIMYVTGDTVNVRKEADASSEKITALAKGTTVTAYEETNGFYEVKLSDGKTGYISSKYLSQEDPKTVTSTPIPSPTATPDTTNGTKMFVIGDGVNVRKGNSTSSDKVAQLVKGKEVTAYAKVGDWTYIQYGTNKYGYISTKFLSDKAPATATPAPTLTIKPSASSTTKPSATATLIPSTTATPTPATNPGYTSFVQLGVAEKIAQRVDGYTEYLSKTAGSRGENYNGNSAPDKISYYSFGTTDGGVYYITYTGTYDAPENVNITETKPTYN